MCMSYTQIYVNVYVCRQCAKESHSLHKCVLLLMLRLAFADHTAQKYVCMFAFFPHLFLFIYFCSDYLSSRYEKFRDKPYEYVASFRHSYALLHVFNPIGICMYICTYCVLFEITRSTQNDFICISKHTHTYLQTYIYSIKAACA